MPVLTTTPYTTAVNGNPLNTYAYNFTTFSGEEPTFRGADEPIPGGGMRYRPKVLGPLALQWVMWVSSRHPDTGINGGRAQAEANKTFLRSLIIGADGTRPLVTIVKTLPSVGGGTHTRTAQAWCNRYDDSQGSVAGTFWVVQASLTVPSGAFT